MSDADKYVVYLRFPFPRGDFKDPEPIPWDESKTQKLWNILSQTQQSDVDWPQLAETFGVSVSFLLQHAAWFYERRLNQVKSHMQRVSSSGQSASLYNSRPPSSTSGVIIGAQSQRATGEDSNESNEVLGVSGAPKTKSNSKPVARGFGPEEGVTSYSRKIPAETRDDSTTTYSLEQTKQQKPIAQAKLGLDEQLAALSLRQREEGEWPGTPPSAASSGSSSGEDSPDVQNPFKLSAPQPPQIEDVASLASTATTSHTNNSSPIVPVTTKILSAAAAGESGFVAQDLEGESHGSDDGQDLSTRTTSEGSNKPQSLDSSNFSDLTDASISRSALEEAVMSDIRHHQASSKSGR